MMSESLSIDPAIFDDVSPTVVAPAESDTVDGDIEIDLASYISNYKGYIYYDRLFFITKRCRSLRAQAFRLAHDYIKNHTLDTSSYNKIFLMMAEQSIISSNTEDSGANQHLPNGVRSNPHMADETISASGEMVTLGSTLSDAAKVVLAEVMSGKNIANLVYDPKWEESTRRKGITLLEHLDTELKNHKANSIKESIRRGSDDLGDLYLQLGQLTNANKCYTRSRDYCTSQHQELAMCLNVIKIAIFQRSWSHVSAHVTRASGLSELRETATASSVIGLSSADLGSRLRGRSDNQSRLSSTTTVHPPGAASRLSIELGTSSGSRLFGRHSSTDTTATTTAPTTTISPASGSSGSQNYRDALAQMRTQLVIAAGLVELAARNYRSAAMNFLQVNPDFCESPTSSIVTASDLAFFITLCSMATFERNELASLVLGSSSLRLLLEAEPVCRDMLQSFHQADYATCLGRLRKLQDFLRLDIFLADHVSVLCREIRSRALCQYFSPYSSADLNRMAKAFDTSVSNLENELAVLIQDGNIKARIDSHKQLLYVLDVDQRCLTFARAMRLAEDYRKRTHSMILRMVLARQKLSVKSTRDEIDNNSFQLMS